ncbi:prepilin-type N-terminal cleavage/methylation domain-containing protein [Novipirellula rosea]|uniref:Prepilin-type N-terminal cleavage/methylation domain-containing protein n=1 Tax=Novipirellula rosea TaxID=1031540 RepID=A0ABP8MZH6_9BACT
MMRISKPKNRDLIKFRNRNGFTLIEMLVAMAVTLLMMAGLARAFAYVGERVRDSRGDVKISNDIRDVTNRMRDELKRCTVTLEPSNGGPDQPGYFLYYEGPMTNATSSLFGPSATFDGQIVPRDARYGDLDDYFAFTAVAKPGSWFTGKVPEFVLTGTSTDTNPVVIRSKYAEIVYFTNPDRNPTTGAVIDVDGDNLPDRLQLYRRVLLIRPDLNLASGGGLHHLTAGANWQTGMATITQQCDLSVRRGLNTNGTQNNTVIANSLDDLAKPHNRFAHVRVPEATLISGGGTTRTSMPILALEPPVGIVANASTTTTPPLRPEDSATNTDPVVLDSRWSGYLRREFVLTGTRQGEDVIATDCRGLDLKIFDPSADFLLTSGSVVVGPGDVGYREALRDSGTPVLLQGGFVDLAYPVLAGGPIRGWQARQMAASSSTSHKANDAFSDATNGAVAITRIQSTFSGISPSITSYTTSISNRTYVDSLLLSGRLVINTSGPQIALFQPAFDTYTSAYERDGYLQDRRYQSGSNQFAGTLWKTWASSDAASIDLGADGLDNNGNPDKGADDPRERETSAPFTTKPEAISITVRLENPSTRQFQQGTVVHRGDR